MEYEIVQKLLELNQIFYQNFAAQFSNTRKRLQPGVKQIVQQIPIDATILDLGCGNGELVNYLTRKGFTGLYIGLDSSAGLLDIIRSQVKTGIQPLFVNGGQDFQLEKLDLINIPQTIFIQVDLSDPSWVSELEYISFKYVLAFAVLHHLPGYDLRINTLKSVHKLLDSGGIFIHSEWQFLNSPRLRSRIQSWNEIGLSPNQVEKGDFLLDWRSGGHGLRYVHHFDTDELNDLANASGFVIIDDFLSDGENNKLGYYQIWKKPAQTS